MPNEVLTQVVAEYSRPELGLTPESGKQKQNLSWWQRRKLLPFERKALVGKTKYRPVKGEYPLLDLGFLSAKKSVGLMTQRGTDRADLRSYELPNFAFFPLKTMEMRLEGRGDFNTDQVTVRAVGVPEAVAAYYENRHHVRIHASGGTRTHWSAKATVGILPDKTRNIIKSERRAFDSLFLVQSDPKWELRDSQSFGRDDLDPLLVGFRGNNCYLLDAFDLTPAEEYVAREFVR